MDETIPIPVMTTRLMIASPCRFRFCVKAVVEPNATSSAGASNLRSRLQCGTLLQETHPQILRAIDNLAVGRKPAVSDA
jgi:hypothetical protein